MPHLKGCERAYDHFSSVFRDQSKVADSKLPAKPQKEPPSAQSSAPVKMDKVRIESEFLTDLDDQSSLYALARPFFSLPASMLVERSIQNR